MQNFVVRDHTEMSHVSNLTAQNSPRDDSLLTDNPLHDFQTVLTAQTQCPFVAVCDETVRRLLEIVRRPQLPVEQKEEIVN